MTPEERRAHVATLYPGDAWKKQVNDMSDAEVTAIYYRTLAHPPKLKISKEKP